MNDDKIDYSVFPDVPEREKEEFYKAYGRAMAGWGAVELSLMMAFAALVRSPDPKCAFNIFRSGISFQNQVNMVSVLIESALNDELKQKWKSVRSNINLSQADRNRFAHMHVWRMCGIALFGQNPKSRNEELPWEWTDRAGHRDVVTTDKLVEAEVRFLSLGRAISDFSEEVCRFFNVKSSAR